MFDWPPYSTEYQRYGAFAKYGVPPHIPIYPNNILSPEYGHDIYGKEIEFPSSEPKALKTQKIEKKKTPPPNFQYGPDQWGFNSENPNDNNNNNVNQQTNPPQLFYTNTGLSKTQDLINNEQMLLRTHTTFQPNQKWITKINNPYSQRFKDYMYTLQSSFKHIDGATYKKMPVIKKEIPDFKVANFFGGDSNEAPINLGDFSGINAYREKFPIDFPERDFNKTQTNYFSNKLTFNKNFDLMHMNDNSINVKPYNYENANWVPKPYESPYKNFMTKTGNNIMKNYNLEEIEKYNIPNYEGYKSYDNNKYTFPNNKYHYDTSQRIPIEITNNLPMKFNTKTQQFEKSSYDYGLGNTYNKTFTSGFNNVNLNESNLNQNKIPTPKIQTPKQKIPTPKNIQNNIQNNVQNNVNEQMPPIQKDIEKQNLNDPKNPAFELVQKITNSKVGLLNNDNSCFINAVVQNLVHNPIFVGEFIKDTVYVFQNNLRQIPVSANLYNLMMDMTTKSKDFSNYPNDNLKECIKSIHPEFSGKIQQDSQEFARYLLQDINLELNRVNPSEYKENFIAQNRPKKIIFNDFIIENNNKENSVITDLFIGYLRFEFVCDCGEVQYNFGQFLDLPLRINEGQKNLDLYELLKLNILRTESIDFNEPCTKCNQIKKRIQNIKIAYLPQILILSIQRKNNDSNIKYYDRIDMNELIDNEIYDGSTKFRLYGIINHKGDVNSGHYYNYNFIDGEWFKFDDGVVLKENPNFNSNEVYTLFYTKVNN